MHTPGPSSPRVRAAVLLLAAALSTLACRSASSLEVRGDVPSGLAASAVVVYPFGFRWKTPSWRAAELSQRLVTVALQEAGEQALFFGPTEVNVYRPEDDDAWGASDAASVLAPYGVRLDAALVLRPWAEKRVQSGQGELVDPQGRTVGQRTAPEEVVYRGHVEVLHPFTRQVVLEVSGDAPARPFDVHDDAGDDATPELTKLMEDLTREALRGLSDVLRAPRAPAPALGRVVLLPWVALGLQEELARRDALDAEVIRQQRLRYANPGLPPDAVLTLAREPAGLYVREAPPGGKLGVGDLVVEVEGRPALPQALARARLAPVPLEARVQQPSGRIVPILLP